jgi:hypothetical protein
MKMKFKIIGMVQKTIACFRFKLSFVQLLILKKEKEEVTIWNQPIYLVC